MYQLPRRFSNLQFASGQHLADDGHRGEDHRNQRVILLCFMLSDLQFVVSASFSDNGGTFLEIFQLARQHPLGFNIINLLSIGS